MLNSVRPIHNSAQSNLVWVLGMVQLINLAVVVLVEEKSKDFKIFQLDCTLCVSKFFDWLSELFFSNKNKINLN